MNILFDNQIFVQQAYGGVSRLFYELIKNLCEKEGANIFLFHGFYINRFPVEDLKKKMEFYFGKRISRPLYTAKFIRVFNTILFDLFKPRKKIDIFHPTEFSPPVYRWKKSPVVLTVYDMIPELFPRFFKNIKTRIKIRKKCIERADKIIAISNSTKKDLIKLYNVDKKKITVIYPGVSSPIEEREGKNLFSHKKPFILYVGNRKHSYKNFRNLLTAYTSNKKVNKEFNLVCFGATPFTGEEKEFFSGTGNRDNIFHVTGNDYLLARFYTNAGVFVYPSLYEGFGLPPLEAMVYGCPVIAGNTSSIPEVLGDAALYFEPFDPSSISFALEKVLFDTGTAQELVKKGSKQVKKYSWSRMAEETYRVYKGVIE